MTSTLSQNGSAPPNQGSEDSEGSPTLDHGGIPHRNEVATSILDRPRMAFEEVAQASPAFAEDAHSEGSSFASSSG
jgi:hypothetical protein